jgi:cysteine desulfuration protein SufE
MGQLHTPLEEVVSKFKSFEAWEDRYKHLIDLGKALEPFPEEFRLESNKVKGCQSQVWLFPELKAGVLVFHADSDAAIVKGIIALLLKAYSHQTPETILQTKTDFIDEIGLRQHLSMNRSNGLNAMVKQIHYYALAYKTLLERQRG